MNRKRNVIILTLALCLLSVFVSMANTKVPASLFSSGQETPTDGSTLMIPSLVGQTMMGATKNDNLMVGSGYFSLSIIQQAIINDPPRILSAAVDTAYKGLYYKYKAVAADPDNEALVFSFHNLPYGFVCQGDSVYSFTVLQNVDTSFTVIVSDGSLADTLFVSLVVSQQVKPFTITSPSLDTAVEDQKYVYTPTSNYDNDPDVTIEYDYRYSFYPAWLSPVIGANGRTTLVGTPLEGDTSTQFIVKAINKADTTTPLGIKEVSLIVVPINDAPQLTLPTSLSAIAGKEFVYQIQATDVDDTLLIFELLKKPDTMTISTKGVLSSWIPHDSLIGSTDTVVVMVKDPHGAADTGSFTVKIIAEGTPYCSNVGPIDSISRDTIAIPFVLVDKNYDTLSLSVNYVLPDGTIKTPKSLLGKTIGIDSSGYASTLYWLSEDDFSDTLIDSVLLEVIPQDKQSAGPPFRTNWFSINNTKALTVAHVSPVPGQLVSSVTAKSIALTFDGPLIDTALLDQSSISIVGSVSGPLAYAMTKSPTVIGCVLQEFPHGGEILSVTASGAIADIHKKTLDGNNNGLFEGPGIDDYTATVSIAKLGDFDKNDTLGSAVDLSYLAAYWYGSATDSIKPDSIAKVEIGPAQGTTPYLKVSPDSLFNFADICTYLQMWYWYANNAVGNTTKRSLVNVSDYSSLICTEHAVSGEAKQAPLSFESSNYNNDKAKQTVQIIHGKENTLQLLLSVRAVSALVASEYTLCYRAEDLTFIKTARNNSLLAQGAADLLVLEQKQPGYTKVSLARLAQKNLAVSGKGEIVSLFFKKENATVAPISIVYSLVNKEHQAIEAGRMSLSAEDLRNGSDLTLVKAFDLSVIPNPMIPASQPSQSALQLVSTARLKSQRHAEGTFIAIYVPTHIKEQLKNNHLSNLTVSLSIYDPLGNTVMQRESPNAERLLATIKSNEHMGFFWNGANRNNRKVRKGTYLVLMRWQTDFQSGVVREFVGVR